MVNGRLPRILHHKIGGKKRIEVNVNFFTNHFKVPVHSSNFIKNLKWIETNQEINYEIFSNFKIDFELYNSNYLIGPKNQVSIAKGNDRLEVVDYDYP